MGVTSRRIGFGVLSALAVLLALRKPSVRDQENDSLALVRRERELSNGVADARLHWSALEQRDAVLASNGASLITISGFPAGAALSKTDSVYVFDLLEMVSKDSAVQVRVHFYFPGSYAAKTWWGLYSGVLISPGERTVCTAIMPIDRRPNGELSVGRNGLVSVLSPCLLLGTFGTPSTPIGNWLSGIRYAAARSGKWLSSSSVDPWDTDPWSWLPERGFDEMSGAQASGLSRLLGLEQVTRLLVPPYYYGQTGVQCLSGLKPSCARAVLDTSVMSEETSELPRDLTLSPSLIRSTTVSLLTPRPPGSTFLSDLIQEKGQERFRRFWKSELPVEPAFEAAFQEPLADWTLRWANKRWLMSWDSRYRSQDVLLGVTLRTSWIPLSLGWSLLAIGAAGWAARRRQVTG